MRDDFDTRRRRRAAAASAALALALLAGGGTAAYYTLGQPGRAPAPVTPASSGPPAPAPAGPAATATASPRASRAAAHRAAAGPGIVAVTTAGAMVVLDPATGAVTRTLVPRGVFGDEISVSGGTVYYAARTGCGVETYSVPLAGGPRVAVAHGAQPAVSPDGTRLAYLWEPYASAGQPLYLDCAPPVTGVPTVHLVIRNLATGAETVYREPPALARSPFVYPVSHLSWSPDGSRLLLSMGEVQDSAGWALVILDPVRSIYYVPANYAAGGGRVPLPGSKTAYYREGAFLPNGHLLVNVVCRQSCPGSAPSSLIQEITPSGRVVRQVAVGFASRDHSSLAASGRWALYLSGTDLYVLRNGNRPVRVAAGLTAATWAG